MQTPKLINTNCLSKVEFETLWEIINKYGFETVPLPVVIILLSQEENPLCDQIATKLLDPVNHYYPN